MVHAAIFAHLHSSPLVVRKRKDTDWKSLSASIIDTTGGSNGETQRSTINKQYYHQNTLDPIEIIDVKEERKLLIQCLRECKKQIIWHTEVADLHSFRKVLSFGCRALHFSGHGVPGQVIFENKQCEAQFISQQELQNLLLAGGIREDNPRVCMETTEDDSSSYSSEGNSSSDDTKEKNYDQRKDLSKLRNRSSMRHYNHNQISDWVNIRTAPQVPVKLVFLSACHSESVADAFVTAGVEHVVVVSKEDKVLDKKAMEFSKSFYTALFAGHSVARSFEIGQVQADISTVRHGAGASQFKLLGNGDHHKTLFRDVLEGDFIQDSLPLPANECDSVAEVFVGRSVVVHQVYKALVDENRLVTITGEKGIGKTEVALQTAQYATERRIFKHIYFIRLAKSADTESISPDSGCRTLLEKFLRCFSVEARDEVELVDALRHRWMDGSNLGKDGNTTNSTSNFANPSTAMYDGSYLLILDGVSRAIRSNILFRNLIGLLLRRVRALTLLVTSEVKIGGGMDAEGWGVGEKIVTIDRLCPRESALLFTLRAPRKLKGREMGASSDLAKFGEEHPVLQALGGHPRTICAVAQFLQEKDLELDQHELLNYIIPSVKAGLCLCGVDNHDCWKFGHHCSKSIPANEWSQHQEQRVSLSRFGHIFSNSVGSLQLSSNCSPPKNHLGNAHHPHHHRVHSHGGAHPHISHPPALQQTKSNESAHSESSTESFPPSKLVSRIIPILRPNSLEASKFSQLLESTIQDETARHIWVNAVLSNSQYKNESEQNESFDDLESNIDENRLEELVNMRDIPLDWLAPELSRYFATELKDDAVKRPLSVRSMDFLSRSAQIWKSHRSPSQRHGYVTIEMFENFWQWFQPLTMCILQSGLWAYTNPRLLHGFLSKGASVNMLQRAPVGTFLLRFSETMKQSFVIAYVSDDHSVQFVPVTWTAAAGDSSDVIAGRTCGHDGWYVALQNNSPCETNCAIFPTIQELILSVRVLTNVFPQTPKTAVFANVPP